MTRRLRNPEVLGWLLMAAAIVVAAAFISWLQRGLMFGSDEFLWIEIAGLGHLRDFFHPYGGHLILFPYLLWRGILELFGVDFRAFAVIQVSGLSLSAALLYIYAKRRIGPILGLAPAIMLLFLGSSWTVLLQPMIGMQFLCALVPGLGAMLMLERKDRRGDIAACLLLILALAGFTEAVAFLVGAALAIALAPEWRRRAWVVVIPTVLYGAWHIWAAQFGAEPISAGSVPWLPTYISDSLAIVATSIFGQGSAIGFGHWTTIRTDGYDVTQFTSGIVIFIVEALVLWRAFWLVRRRRGSIPLGFWPALAILLTLWIAQGLVFASDRTPAEIRYIYAGALLLMLVVLELLRGIKVNRVSIAVAVILTGAAIVGNIAHFREGRQLLDVSQAAARADIAVVQFGGTNVKHTFTPNVTASKVADGSVAFNNGPWRKVTKRYGSTGFTVAELQGQSEEIREQADRVAALALELRLVPAQAPGVGCKRVASAKPGGPVAVALPPGGAVLSAAAHSSVRLRRWSRKYPVKLGGVGAEKPVELRIPADRASSVRWWARLATAGSIEVCRL